MRVWGRVCVGASVCECVWWGRCGYVCDCVFMGASVGACVGACEGCVCVWLRV